jgi:tRNA dimethylallyltransferase
MEKVVVILGATCTGKSKIGLSLAKKFNGEIISADSVQIFKEFDIGSAKITKEEMDGVVHYGIDEISPDKEFSVFDYASWTKEKIKEIAAKGKLPIIVGGTGLYVKALCEGYNFGGTEKHAEFRQNLEKEIDENGIESVYQKLVKLNPEMAQSIDKNNKVRVIRAFEIAKFGEVQTKSKPEFDFKIFALVQDREKLYQKINLRVDQMVDSGLKEEVENLYKKYGLVQPMRAIGYKELIPYIKGEDSFENCVNLIKQHTRNYAKRQMTFLRSMKDVNFVDIENFDSAFENITEKINLFITK